MAGGKGKVRRGKSEERGKWESPRRFALTSLRFAVGPHALRLALCCLQCSTGAMCKGLRARFAEGAANHSSRPALSPLRIALRPKLARR